MPLQDQANLHTRAAILLSKHKKRCCARTIRCAPSRSAATAHRLAPERKCGTSPPLQLALKEWAVTCAALGGGDQTVCVQCLLNLQQVSSGKACNNVMKVLALLGFFSQFCILSLFDLSVLCHRLSCEKEVSVNPPSSQQLTPSSSFLLLFTARQTFLCLGPAGSTTRCNTTSLHGNSSMFVVSCCATCPTY